jgi:hypothetical protein
MKYETPELTALTPAINAIQSSGTTHKTGPINGADGVDNECVSVYLDWE